MELADRDGEDKVEAKGRAWLRTASFVGLNQPRIFNFLREYNDIDETVRVDPLPTMTDVERLNKLAEEIGRRDRAEFEAKQKRREEEAAREAELEAENMRTGYKRLFCG